MLDTIHSQHNLLDLLVVFVFDASLNAAAQTYKPQNLLNRVKYCLFLDWLDGIGSSQNHGSLHRQSIVKTDAMDSGRQMETQG